jgi:hypothetical protein
MTMPDPFGFDRETAVVPRPGDPCCYDGELHEGWQIGMGIHGGLLLAVDALPPVSLDLGLGGWVPTLELTVHVRARPASGWLRLTHSTRNFAHGYLEEDAEVWDSSGRLVAQSRQLARVSERRRGRAAG